MTLYEQIEDSYDKSYEYIGEEPEFDSGWRAAISYVLHAIISQHRCIPDRDALAAAFEKHPSRSDVVGYGNSSWDCACANAGEHADAIIAALEQP